MPKETLSPQTPHVAELDQAASAVVDAHAQLAESPFTQVADGGAIEGEFIATEVEQTADYPKVSATTSDTSVSRLGEKGGRITRVEDGQGIYKVDARDAKVSRILTQKDLITRPTPTGVGKPPSFSGEAGDGHTYTHKFSPDVSEAVARTVTQRAIKDIEQSTSNSV